MIGKLALGGKEAQSRSPKFKSSDKTESWPLSLIYEATLEGETRREKLYELPRVTELRSDRA